MVDPVEVQDNVIKTFFESLINPRLSKVDFTLR